MVLYTILLIIVYLPVKLLFPVKVIGKKNIPKKSPYILVSNHLAWSDIFIVSVNLWGYRRIIGKKELGKNVFLRVLVKGIGAILIDRQSVDLTSIRASVKSLKEGKPLIIFPEGTRNRTGTDELQELKQGAAMIAIKGGAPVVPAMIYKKQRIFRRNYLYVGEPIYFNDLYGKRLDSESLNQATELMAVVMGETKEKLQEFVESKKRRRKNKQQPQEPYEERSQELQSSSTETSGATEDTDIKQSTIETASSELNELDKIDGANDGAINPKVTDLGEVEGTE